MPKSRAHGGEETKGMMLNLHLLRALAALAVVYYHITSDAGLDLAFNIGAHGVDVFFVISGFIIAYVGTRSPDRFLSRRLIRVVPFYWTATLAVFLLAALLPHLFRSTQPDVTQLLCSLFFIPRETAYAGMFPTLILGWSLNYEMYFYVMFALSLRLSARHAPVVCCAGITLVAALIHLSGSTQPSVQFYARPLVFEFVFGVMVFYVYRICERHAEWFSRRIWLRATLLIVGLGSAAMLGLEEFNKGMGLPRFLSAGIPAMAIVLAALLLERMYRLRSESKILFLVGESSYILYLIHPYVVYGVLRTVFRNSASLSTPALFCVIALLMLSSSIIAVCIHLWFEKPVMAFLRRCLLRSPAALATSAA